MDQNRFRNFSRVRTSYEGMHYTGLFFKERGSKNEVQKKRPRHLSWPSESGMNLPMTASSSPLRKSDSDGNFSEKMTEIRRKILKEFQDGNKDQAIRLLPQVDKPHTIRDYDGVSGYTLLHHAARHAWSDICRVLVEQYKCNPVDTNSDGQSVLHTACLFGHVSVIKYLLTLQSVSVTLNDRDGYGNSAMECVTRNKYEIYSLFSSQVHWEMELFVRAYFKIFLLGNTRSGKSSLTAFLKKLSMGAVSTGMVSNVQELTAGICPTYCEVLPWPHSIFAISPRILIYDMAGHSEFYSSHAAILETLIHKSPAIFIILVDLTKKNNVLSKELYYWTSFLEIQSRKISSHIIIVGSHSDMLTLNSVKEKCEYVEKIAKDAFQKKQFAGIVPLDCHKLSEDYVQPLLTVLKDSYQTLATSAKDEKMSFSCHLLHSLLIDKVKKTAMTLEDLMELIASEDQPALPSDPAALATFLETLVDKGLILFHRNSTCLFSSCIVIDQRAFLEEVNQKLFAPTSFKEHRDIASNTGIVPASLLHDIFPNYDTELLVVLLTVLEFCHELDPALLETIYTDLSTGCISREQLLFFPALVSAGRPCALAIAKGFGWAVFCTNPYQILTTRLLQMILLRLAFKFCLTKQSLPELSLPRTHKLHSLSRKCTVWKNGIYWKTEDGIEAVVEVSEQHRRVSLIVSCDESNCTEHIKLRSSLIAEILAIFEEFCPSIDLEEYLIPPCEVMKLLDHNLAEMSVFSIHDVARCILLRKRFVSSVDEKNETNPESLLFSDPYLLLPPTMVQQLFDSDRSCQPVSEIILRELQKHCGAIPSMFSSISTHLSLQDKLNKLSVFAGRNPLDVGGVTAADLPPPDTATDMLPEEPLVCGIQQKAGLAAERILQKKIVIVTEVVKTCLNDFHNRLMEKFLVGEGVFDPDDKTMKKAEYAFVLYLACMRAVKADSSKFFIVMTILSNYPLLEQAVQEMAKEGVEAGLLMSVTQIQGDAPPNQRVTPVTSVAQKAKEQEIGQAQRKYKKIKATKFKRERENLQDSSDDSVSLSSSSSSSSGASYENETSDMEGRTGNRRRRKHHKTQKDPSKKIRKRRRQVITESKKHKPRKSASQMPCLLYIGTILLLVAVAIALMIGWLTA